MSVDSKDVLKKNVKLRFEILRSTTRVAKTQGFKENLGLNKVEYFLYLEIRITTESNDDMYVCGSCKLKATIIMSHYTGPRN